MTSQGSVVSSIALVACLAAGSCNAADDTNAMAKIKDTLQTRFPDIEILEVNPSPVPNIYEIFVGDSIAYSDLNGDYLLSGPLLQTRTQRNLTAESLDQHNAVDFNKLPLNQAIKTVKGNGRRQLAVFADPDCPYCQRLEKELAAVDDVTIYTFLYPLTNLHPQAAAKARLIWCTPDRSQAWRQWMTEHTAPRADEKCDDTPLEDNEKLGQELRINSTPVLFNANGRRMSGARQAAQIEEFLSQPSQ